MTSSMSGRASPSRMLSCSVRRFCCAIADAADSEKANPIVLKSRYVIGFLGGRLRIEVKIIAMSG
jgi:hypothetical protein